jgi:diguanylate cyclase (GGDEF)-like protein
VNDEHGHAAGDAVLRWTASIMRKQLRPYDLVGRHGGEEFVVVLPGCDARGAMAAAERLRAAVAGTVVPLGAGGLRVTCSIGVAVWNAPDRWTREALLDAADGALYEAKSSGRNRVVFAPSPVRLPLAAGGTPRLTAS